ATAPARAAAARAAKEALRDRPRALNTPWLTSGMLTTGKAGSGRAGPPALLLMRNSSRRGGAGAAPRVDRSRLDRGAGQLPERDAALVPGRGTSREAVPRPRGRPAVFPKPRAGDVDFDPARFFDPPAVPQHDVCDGPMGQVAADRPDGPQLA